MPYQPNALVCQFLEKASGKVLEKYKSIIRSYVHRRHGVYALYRRDRLYYVGLARNLRGRLGGHLRDRHARKWDRFSIYLTIGDEHIRELESLILRVASPPGNKQRGKFPKAENLLARLKQTFRVEHRRELLDLFGRRGKVIPILISKNHKRAVLAKYNLGGHHLRGTHKGHTFKARVRRDGLIRFQHKLYRSPSHAAAKAVRTAVNGWWFWKYERAPGDWVRLNTVRK